MAGRSVARIAGGLAVLGLLVGCGSKADPTVARARAASEDLQRCKAEVRTLKTAVEAYAAKEGRLPTTVADLTADEAFLESTPRWAVLGSGGRVTVAADAPEGCVKDRRRGEPVGMAPGASSGDAVELCQTEARTVQTAAAAFDAQMGRYPMAMSELTADQAFLRNTPTYVDLGPNGTVTFKATAPAACRDGGGPSTTTAVDGPNG